MRFVSQHYYMSKITKIIAIIIALSLTLGNVGLAAEPTVTIVPKWTETNIEAKECGGFPEDSYILTIKVTKDEIKHEFCSSYGKADAKIVQDARGVNFLILKYSQGRGTHVTSEYVSVYRIEKDLEEYSRFPVSEPLGRISNVYYDYKITKPKSGGLLFMFNVRIVTDPEDSEWAYLLRKEKKRTLLIK